MSSASQTQHALYMFTRTFHKYKHQSFLNLQTFSDGLPFASMLSSIQFFTPIIQQLDRNPQKWTQKLTNLKKLLTKMQSYVQIQSQKILKINDLQLVQIAKNASQQQTLKFFQIVIAVLMQTPQKQDYIQVIMGLDERSQQALVIVVQNAMQFRISQLQSNKQISHASEQIAHLKNQNNILNQQIQQLCLQNESLQKQVTELKYKLQQSQQEIQKARNLNIEMYMNNNNRVQSQQRQTSLIQTLKKKMIDMSRQHEIDLTKVNDEVYHLKSKLAHYKDIQEQLIQRNKILEERTKSQFVQGQMQRKRNEKSIDEKDSRIKKLEYELQIAKNKIQQLTQDIDMNDLNLRMQLQKKQVRFKQLQKQVKNRLIEPTLDLNVKKLSGQQCKSPQRNQQNQQQIQYLRIQIQKLRNSTRQLQRQNIKMKKRGEKVLNIESEKKKLQKIILDVSKCRDSEIQMLVVSLYDLRNQNIRMHEIIRELKGRVEIKGE